MINRKYSEMPDRKKKIDEKYFFIMEKIDFENLKIFIFFSKKSLKDFLKGFPYKKCHER